MKKNIKTKLQTIDKDHYLLLTDIGKVAKEEGLKVYLVGGMIRDLLLGFDNLDIDLVVENDAGKLANALIKKFTNCQLSAKHDRFHTAKVIFNINNKNIPVDLASTREEKYEYPAALPQVSVSDLKKDLYRRDFTINALAVSILPEDFGEVVDLFDGLKDLEERKIKILHDLSFTDDPTRMIRAVRFASKLGFKIEDHTQTLLNSAINSKRFDNLIEKIRGDRVKTEIRYLFNLPDIDNAIKAFFDSGIYRMVSIELEPTIPVIAKRFEEPTKQSNNVSHNKWLIYFALTMKDLLPEQQEQTLQNLQLTSDEIKIIKNGFNALNKFKEQKSLNSIIVYQELKNLSVESILIVRMLNNKMNDLINEYLTKTSKTKLEISGQDLINLGVKEGKRIGEILEKLIEIKIKNPSLNKQDEIKEAKKFI